MRRLDSFDDADLAERFAAALRRGGITAEARPEAPKGAAVWVADEDQIDRARADLLEFRADPTAERFRPVGPEPAAGPPAAARPETRPRGPAWKQVPVTVSLIAVSLIVGGLTRLKDEPTRVGSALSIASYEGAGLQAIWAPEAGLADVRAGQVWRLVTPIFIHFGPLHLFFNALWVWMLGGAIESLRGPLRTAILVLTVAVSSNLAEFYFRFGLSFDQANGFRSDIGWERSPFFGGLSGVVFGLFGYVWMQARLFPGSGFRMPRDTVVWMMIWLLACTAGLVGNIANVAHAVGLLVGLAAGAAPRLWRRS